VNGFTRKLITWGAVLTLGTLSALGLNILSADAHSGAVTVTQTCAGWTASVDLAHNVTSDRFVQIVTTIPGTIGIGAPGNHYNATFGNVWSASGSTVTSGTVTLNIYLNNDDVPGVLEFSTHASLPEVGQCETTTTSSSTTTVSSTSTSTSTLPKETTTLPEETTSTVPSTTTTLGQHSTTTVPLTSTTVGRHSTSTSSAPVTGTPKRTAPTSPAPLPRTGTNMTWPVLAAFLCLVLGVGAIFVGKRRDARTSRS
jgi:LPXTG-motif cell wall-anchored protein